MSGAAELMRGRLAERRSELEAYNPRAIDVAANALAALHSAVYRFAAAVRCDRQARFRVLQVSGERGLPIEDLIAIGAERPEGKAGVVELLRVVAEFFGYTLEPIVNEQQRIHETVAAVSRAAGALGADFTLANADGVLDPRELLALEPTILEVESRAAELKAAIAKARGNR